MTLRADIADEVVAKVDAYVVEQYGPESLGARPSLRLVIRVAAMIASLTLDVRERMKGSDQ